MNNEKMREKFNQWYDSAVYGKITGMSTLDASWLGYQAALAQQAEPEVSQPVAYGDKLGTHLQCVYAIPSTGTPVWMLAMTPLYLAPPDCEALKAENEQLKLRVTKLGAKSDCDFKEYKRLRDKFQYGFFGGLPEAEIDEGVDVDIQEQAR